MASPINGIPYLFLGPDNLLSLINDRLDPAKMDVLIKAGKDKGLDGADELLARQDYRGVLKAVWSERDRERRLTWLRSHEAASHPLLLLEQAMSEFSQNPTEDTFVNKMFPLTAVAKFRLGQDFSCSTNPNISETSLEKNVVATYVRVISGLVEKKMPQTNFIRLMENNEQQIKAVSKKKVEEVARRSLTQQLPSVQWVKDIDDRPFLAQIKGTSSSEVSLLIPEDQVKAARDKVALDAIRHYQGDTANCA